MLLDLRFFARFYCSCLLATSQIRARRKVNLVAVGAAFFLHLVAIGRESIQWYKDSFDH